jgi:hypothetical protein
MDHSSSSEGTAPGSAGQFASIVSFMTQSAGGPSKREVVIKHGRTSLRFRLASLRGNFPGAVIVEDAEGDHTLGRIQPDGAFVPSGRWKPWHQGALEQIAGDPGRAASDSGRLAGRCAFCRRPLASGVSAVLGYGPECATLYRLPYSEKAAEFVRARQLESV